MPVPLYYYASSLITHSAHHQNNVWKAVSPRRRRYPRQRTPGWRSSVYWPYVRSLILYTHAVVLSSYSFRPALSQVPNKDVRRKYRTWISPQECLTQIQSSYEPTLSLASVTNPFAPSTILISCICRGICVRLCSRRLWSIVPYLSSAEPLLTKRAQRSNSFERKP